MSRGRIVDAVKQGRKLVSDGAWGTFLQQKGLQPGQCPELWCVERPDDVFDVAQAYASSGCDMILTNSFGGNRFKLRHFDLTVSAEEINRAAAEISRRAAGEGLWVLGSMGPTGVMLVLGDVKPEELLEAFAQQGKALEQGGADAVCIETMSALDEASLAVEAARKSTDCEVICTFTFEKNARGEYRTMMGAVPEDAARAAVDAGAHVCGTNCGNGFAGMIDIVKQMRQVVPDTPILVHANAGLPQSIDGVDVFPETPEQMAELVPQLVEAGADIIGGCCGTTPEHIRAIREAVEKL